MDKYFPTLQLYSLNGAKSVYNKVYEQEVILKSISL